MATSKLTGPIRIAMNENRYDDGTWYTASISSEPMLLRICGISDSPVMAIRHAVTTWRDLRRYRRSASLAQGLSPTL